MAILIAPRLAHAAESGYIPLGGKIQETEWTLAEALELVSEMFYGRDDRRIVIQEISFPADLEELRLVLVTYGWRGRWSPKDPEAVPKDWDWFWYRFEPSGNMGAEHMARLHDMVAAYGRAIPDICSESARGVIAVAYEGK